MFVGAINSTVRKFLASNAQVFNGATLVVGCSGNFTSETVLTAFANPSEIHGNDVAFYSCMAGHWLTGQPLEFEIAEPEFDWLKAYLISDQHKLATIMVLLDMLEYVKRNNAHKIRMWNLYLDSFGSLVEKTLARLNEVEVRLTSFFAGDVFKHFERFNDKPDAIFCCYAPTYSGGYERLYKRLEEIVQWDIPTYELLDDDRRDMLLNWMQRRRFLWYDDRLIEDMTPVMQQQSGIHKTVYLYSNVIESPAFFVDEQPGELPKYPLASGDFVIDKSAKVSLFPIKTTELRQYKEAYLAKNIKHGSGQWAFAVMINDLIIGFLEFSKGKYDPHTIYIMSDFAVTGTRYKRLSKFIVMLAKSGETKYLVERRTQVRVRLLTTTAFTNNPVSMKYRGVFELAKRGETSDGQKFLNYESEFNNLNWQETLKEWLTKHASRDS